DGTMNRVLVVTGGSRGIGAAIAEAGARAGYSVCINYRRSRAAAEALAARIRSDTVRAIAVEADVGDSAAVDRMFRTVDEELGAVTALVNNAGHYAGVARVDEMVPQQLIDTFATNIFSYFYCSREAVRRMSTKHGGTGGVIVNISS